MRIVTEVPRRSGQRHGRGQTGLVGDLCAYCGAGDRGGIQVADPVQLYLDCRSAGERALEAADAIRVEMRS